jgi:hypothetical protein
MSPAMRSARGLKSDPAAAGGALSMVRVVGLQPPILKTFPPQIGQVPESAGFPFFMVILVGF